MSQKGFAPILILVVALVMVAAWGGIYFFVKSQTPKHQSQNPIVVSPTPQPIVSASPSPAPNSAGETANWKTYTGDKIFFEYPKEAVVSKDSDGSIHLQYKESYVSDGVELPNGYLFIFKLDTLGNKTLQQVAEADYKSMEDLKMSGCFTKPLISTTINGYSVYTYTGGCQVEGKNIFLSNDNEEYLKITISTNEEKKNYQDTINKILSTFKFNE